MISFRKSQITSNWDKQFMQIIRHVSKTIKLKSHGTADAKQMTRFFHCELREIFFLLSSSACVDIFLLFAPMTILGDQHH